MSKFFAELFEFPI